MVAEVDLAERDAKIVAWAKTNPCSTLQEIGSYYGVTRERVRQILKREGVHKPAPRQPRPHCRDCGKELALENKSGRCRNCRDQGVVTIECSGCGKLFERAVSLVLFHQKHPRYKEGRMFCSGDCKNHHPSERLKEAGRRNLAEARVRRVLKTHCKHGHEFTPENTAHYGQRRQCKECYRRRSLEFYYRKRARA